MLKIDIDNAEVEMELIRQIFADPSISSLIDELYFEHHVNWAGMHRWWSIYPESIVKDARLSDSYNIFTKMRHMGIRAHGWV